MPQFKAVRTFWQKADIFPPVLVRLLARHPHGAPLTDREIAGRCSLNPGQIHAIGWCVDWSGIDLPTMREYLRGCGVDFCSRSQMRRLLAYVRRGGNYLAEGGATSRGPGKWSYLRRSPDWESRWRPMLAAHLKSIKHPPVGRVP